MTPYWVTWSGLVHHLSLFLFAQNSLGFSKHIPLSPVTLVLPIALEQLWTFISPSQKFFEHQIDWYLCSPWLSFHGLLVKFMSTLIVVIPTCNSSYSGGWGRRITNSNQVNVSKYDQDQLGKFSENLSQIFKQNQRGLRTSGRWFYNTHWRSWIQHKQEAMDTADIGGHEAAYTGGYTWM